MRRRLLRAAAPVMGLALLIVLSIVANKQLVNKNDLAIPKNTVSNRSLQVEVLNAAGGGRLAQRFTDYLRSQGYDVVDYGNARSQDAKRTIVVDRVGKMDAARRIAETLGLTEDCVIQRIDKTLFVDATVIIGRDYGSLKKIPQ